jgi:hypothetical protein
MQGASERLFGAGWDDEDNAGGDQGATSASMMPGAASAGSSGYTALGDDGVEASGRVRIDVDYAEDFGEAPLDQVQQQVQQDLFQRLADAEEDGEDGGDGDDDDDKNGSSAPNPRRALRPPRRAKPLSARTRCEQFGAFALLTVVLVTSMVNSFGAVKVVPTRSAGVFQPGDAVPFEMGDVHSPVSPFSQVYHLLPVTCGAGRADAVTATRGHSAGAAMAGFRAESPAALQLRALVEVDCAQMCEVVADAHARDALRWLVDARYSARYFVDLLPATLRPGGLLQASREGAEREGERGGADGSEAAAVDTGALGLPVVPGGGADPTQLPLGRRDPDGTYVLYNHLRLFVQYSTAPSGAVRVVGAQMDLVSLDLGSPGQRAAGGGGSSSASSPSNATEPLLVCGRDPSPSGAGRSGGGGGGGGGRPEQLAGRLAAWTYSVTWERAAPDTADWPRRWIPLLFADRDAAFFVGHLFPSLLYLTSGVVALVFVHSTLTSFSAPLSASRWAAALCKEPRCAAVRRVCCCVCAMQQATAARRRELYARVQDAAQVIKPELVRSPAFPLLLACAVGTGAQLLCSFLITLLVCAMGLLGPASPGSALDCFFTTTLMTGYVSGFVGYDTYLFAGGQREWRVVVLFLWLLFPLAFLVPMAALQGSYRAANAAEAWQVGHWISGAVMMIFSAGPTTFAGAFLADYSFSPGKRMRRLLTQAARVQDEERSAGRAPPRAPRYGKCALALCLLAGGLPFFPIMIETAVASDAQWSWHLYALHGPLLLAIVAALTAAAAVATVNVLVAITVGEFRWWWLSFVAPALSGLLITVELVALALAPGSRGAAGVPFPTADYKGDRLDSVAVYVAWSLMEGLAITLAFGTVGFLTTRRVVEEVIALPSRPGQAPDGVELSTIASTSATAVPRTLLVALSQA